MSDTEKPRDEFPSEMTETQLGPVGAGLPAIPQPATWNSAYGLDEAVALAIVPDRALIFWELAGIIQAGTEPDTQFRLIRMGLKDETPKREKHWTIEPIGRFQDGGLTPGNEYLYVLARVHGDEETPLMVTNPIRMPLLFAPYGMPSPLPSSIDLANPRLRKALKEDD